MPHNKEAMSSLYYFFPIFHASTYPQAKSLWKQLHDRFWSIYVPPRQKHGELSRRVELDEESSCYVGVALVFFGSHYRKNARMEEQMDYASKRGIRLLAITEGEEVPKRFASRIHRVLNRKEDSFFFPHLEHEFVDAVWDHPWQVDERTCKEGEYSLFRDTRLLNNPSKEQKHAALNMLYGGKRTHDLDKMRFDPALKHLFLYGPKRAGKTGYMKTLLLGLMIRNKPRNLRLAIFDPKDECHDFDENRYLWAPIARKKQECYDLIYALEEEGHRRLKLYDKVSFSCGEKEYNEQAKKPLPAIVVVVDDLSASRFFMDGVKIVADIGRHCDIHFIVLSDKDEREYFGFPQYGYMDSARTPVRLCDGEHVVDFTRSYVSKEKRDQLLRVYRKRRIKAR